MKPLVMTPRSPSLLSLLLPTLCSSPYSSLNKLLSLPLHRQRDQDRFQAPDASCSLIGSRWHSYLRTSLPHCPSSFIGHRWPQITKRNSFPPGSLSPWLFCSNWHWHHSLLTDIFSLSVARILCYAESSAFLKPQAMFVCSPSVSFSRLHTCPRIQPQALLLARWPPDLVSPVPCSRLWSSPRTQRQIFTTDLCIGPVQLDILRWWK